MKNLQVRGAIVKWNFDKKIMIERCRVTRQYRIIPKTVIDHVSSQVASQSGTIHPGQYILLFYFFLCRT